MPEVAAHTKINIKSTAKLAGDADAFNYIPNLRLLMILNGNRSRSQFKQ
jgi:hypothetical protein